MITTARIDRVGYIGWRGMLGCEVLELDPQFTALVGRAGTGKSTLLMCLTYALLPDRRTLDIRPISQLEDTHLAGQDTLVGRIAEDYGYAYVILDITTRHAQRLLAGIHVQSIEGRTSFTSWVLRNPPAATSIQQLFAIEEGDTIQYPDLPDLKRHLASHGYDFTTCRTVGEYGQTLYDAGILPGPMLNQEERSQYANLLEATFQGGISPAITKRLKDYLLPAQTQVHELIQGIRDCTNEVFKTRRAVAEATRDLTRLQSTYGAGKQAVLTAHHSIEREIRSATETIHALTDSVNTRETRNRFLTTAIPSLKTEIETAQQTKENTLKAALSELQTAQLDQQHSAEILSHGKQQVTESVDSLKLFRQGEALWAQLLGSRSINSYESFKTLLDQELDHHVGQQAELKLAMDTLHKEDQQLKDLRASSHSEQLAEALNTDSLHTQLTTLSPQHARAMELTLGHVTEGVIGAPLDALKSLTPSPHLPDLFWIGENLPQAVPTQRVGEWEAASFAGGHLVISPARLPTFSAEARQQRRQVIARQLADCTASHREHGVQLQGLKYTKERLLEQHEVLKGYLAQRAHADQLERRVTQAQAAYQDAEAQHATNRERYTKAQAKLASLQQPYDRQIAQLQATLRSHETEQALLDRDIQSDRSALTREAATARAAQAARQSAKDRLGSSFDPFLTLAEAEPNHPVYPISLQSKRINELTTTLGDELTQRYESLRQMNADDRGSIIRIWPDLMTIIRDTVNTTLADMEGEDLIHAMQRQRAELDTTLLQQEQEVRINARNIHLNITNAIRAQRGRIEKLSKFGNILEFGNVTGIRITLVPRKPMLEILEQFADQLSLFTTEKPIDAVLQEFFAAAQPDGLKASSEQLLDYRHYVDLIIEARRKQSEWEPATALSGTESIGCGLAIALMLVRSITERQEGHKEKVKVAEVCPIFAVDEAGRLDPAAQHILVEFARRERFQLVVTAPDLTPTYACTLYALKREFHPTERLIIRGVRVKDSTESR